MQLNQVNLSYVAAEDRLLLRINTLDGAEFRFWLTRSVVIRMMAGLEQSEKVLQQHEMPQSANPTLQRALEQFDREAAGAESDYSTPFAAEAAQFPLGQQPLLVVGMEVATQEDHASCAFALANGQTLTINLTIAMVASISRLLADLLKGVDWNLPSCAIQRPVLRMAESETLH